MNKSDMLRLPRGRNGDRSVLRGALHLIANGRTIDGPEKIFDSSDCCTNRIDLHV